MSDNQKKLQELLQQLALGQGPIKPREIPEEQRKEMKDYKFWNTQPVPSLDVPVVDEGPIDIKKSPADIPDTPLPMLSDFEWCDIDVDSSDQLEDLFVLLNENYVEDKDASFRFNYTKEFFNWALKSPGWKKEWHVGVRVKKTQKLIAFISAIPVNLRVRDNEFKSVEINFLCIHKQLRSKRLAPVLIKEITRRVNKCDIWQALYTSGTILPSPISTCRYAHRPINWSKLFDVGFTGLPINKTKADMLAYYAIPNTTKTKGLRQMTPKDVDQALNLFDKYQTRFDIVQNFSRDEFEHWFLGSNECNKVVFSYVVEDEEGKITDFFSFYSLPFTILDNAIYKELGIGYLFYYASDADFGYNDRFDKDASKCLEKRLNSLISDAIVLAKEQKMDVFNALTSQDNCLFLDDLKFGPGDGFLNFYLFNYKALPIGNGLTEDKKYDTVNRSNIGVVML
ncbi:glycylpeptide N-tetradecanoyltransferase NMT1 PWA37_004316 [Arxiozyma heterogenica]|uniref:glycylpeptide N-tetradecanoyltransferase NMT1 n=1 Tax=Arxiozyma heterogenica TaxID=278026 RepID=UPI002F082BE9